MRYQNTATDGCITLIAMRNASQNIYEVTEEFSWHNGHYGNRVMKNKWASYTKKSDLLIFNAELLDMDKELGDYVIVHELLHFRAPNHGKLWKSLMHAYLDDYERLEKRLEVRGM